MTRETDEALAALRAEVLRLQEAQTFSDRSVESLDAQVRELHALLASLAARITALESERRADAESESPGDDPEFE